MEARLAYAWLNVLKWDFCVIVFEYDDHKVDDR